MTPEDKVLERICNYHKRAKKQAWFTDLLATAEDLNAKGHNRKISVHVRTEYPELYKALRNAMREHGCTSHMINNRMVYALLYGETHSVCQNPKCLQPIYKFTDYFRYATHCNTKCAGYTRNKKLQASMLLTYGVPNPQQVDKLRRKSRKTNMARYGVAYVTQSAGFIARSLATKEARPESAKRLERKRREATSLERFGVRHVSMLDTTKQTKREKMLAKTEEERASINELSRTTRLTKYGTFTPQEAIAKARATYEKRTGYTHQLRNPNVLEAMLGNRYKRTSIVDCNGRTHNVQGFEHHVIASLSARSDKPKQIWSAPKDVGSVDVDGNGRGAVYFPDIRILTKAGLPVVLEVKSTYTVTDPKNLPKFVAADKQLRREGGLFRIALVHGADHIETLTTQQWKRRYA